MKVLSFGEILWDIINGEEYLVGHPVQSRRIRIYSLRKSRNARKNAI
jgi:hypothetical protein